MVTLADTYSRGRVRAGAPRGPAPAGTRCPARAGGSGAGAPRNLGSGGKVGREVRGAGSRPPSPGGCKVGLLGLDPETRDPGPGRGPPGLSACPRGDRGLPRRAPQGHGAVPCDECAGAQHASSPGRKGVQLGPPRNPASMQKSRRGRGEPGSTQAAPAQTPPPPAQLGNKSCPPSSKQRHVDLIGRQREKALGNGFFLLIFVFKVCVGGGRITWKRPTLGARTWAQGGIGLPYPGQGVAMEATGLGGSCLASRWHEPLCFRGSAACGFPRTRVGNCKLLPGFPPTPKKRLWGGQ